MAKQKKSNTLTPRSQFGLSLKDFADLLGTTASMIHMWENNQRELPVVARSNYEALTMMSSKNRPDFSFKQKIADAAKSTGTKKRQRILQSKQLSLLKVNTRLEETEKREQLLLKNLEELSKINVAKLNDAHQIAQKALELINLKQINLLSSIISDQLLVLRLRKVSLEAEINFLTRDSRS